ncbi:MAG: hypothetical protein ACC653_01570 [Gammaproteobacteria bacterium]
MANTLYRINNATEITKSDTQIMTVGEALNGGAKSLVMDNGSEFDGSFIHASSVPHLLSEDKVIVQKISGNYIITDKLRQSGERPTIGFDINEDGSLNLYSDVQITLKTLNAKIDVLANGKILIDGNEVYSISNGINRMQGTSIELN